MQLMHNETNPHKICLRRRALLAVIYISAVCMSYVYAGEVDVMEATINSQGDDTFTIAVTLKHGDTGWDHYADRWDVMDKEGNVLGSRVLSHPHVNEQPFTRSLTLTIPKGINVVFIRAHDSVHGLTDTSVELAIPEQ